MLLTITTTHTPASDLSYLLHKHPAKAQQVELSGGIAHVFYTEVTEEKCTAALLLDIDPVGLVRKNSGPSGNDFALEQYVNDRPYVASSFMSAAIAKAFSTAMNGRCKDKPELVTVPMPFDITIAVLPVRGGEKVLQELFSPLGYTIDAERHALDPAFPSWGESRYFTVRLRNTITLQQLLSHLYILIPVCDNDKHYWVGQAEVEKLLEKGKDWLPAHPANEFITYRYLKNQKGLANQALEILMKDETIEPEETIEPVEPKIRVHDLRLQTVKDELLKTDAKRIADLGCGEGKLLRYLLPEKQFEYILGMDVSYRSIEIVKDKLKIDRMPPKQQERIQLIQGALTYRDKRLEGFDAAVLVEVIEHLDPPRLSALEKVVFQYAKPKTVIITTPNAEYNVKFANFEEGQMRHADHRFEWTRSEFATWGNKVAEENAYTVIYKPLGEEDPETGALSQMAIFTSNTGINAER
ncbi:3' terminal RNA ribose 2'-O-methyltransferase Hen1 [Chitinophaga sp. CF118]|uniref:3' terminal RNA ribose 2'-O-methyltransferase Hen1 n=1 Tax=Chitinophaga sp. CF118 TaxID=1884367 RepID=UPI0008E02F9B|nr:3' terminal RNA ribose 2'-O-methyltransferase Hen1 [Chitinophaga sp. CF118]SFD23412.1 3' terminal RNA ribose 2'-O-methyltransferase Hen1 [Chitinophaga sp. CF118]